jgi:hypothetical protein
VDVLQPYRNWVRMGWYAAGNDFASLARSRLTLATYWYRVGRDDTYLRGLIIMVSSVGIRVPPLLKVLQIAEKYRDPTELPKPPFWGVSTAGSRKGLIKCGCGGELHAVCGMCVGGKGYPDIVVL